MELDTNCKTCELDGATYIGRWSIVDGSIYYFELEQSFGIDDEIPDNILYLKDRDIMCDESGIYGWTSVVQGEYSPTDEELH